MVKLIVETPNYAATVVKVHTLLPLENCDNVVGFPIFGLQAIVPNTTKVGDMGVVFTPETELSEKYCQVNNLYREVYLNDDQNAPKGYMERNRRVKAMRFRTLHKSNALFMPLESLADFGDISELKEGDEFNYMNGELVCKKHIPYRRNSHRNHVAGKEKKFERIDNLTFPEHLDSENYWKSLPLYHDDDLVIVTQKLHGTSARFGYVRVKRQLNWFERFLKKLGVKVQETEYDYIAGSRKVIKDLKAEKQFNNFYEVDLWNDVLERVKPVLPKDLIVYGEIIGWAGKSPIQKNFTYGYTEGVNELFVYRIAIVNEDGYSTDLSWAAVEEFCRNNGLKTVPTFEVTRHKDFKVDEYMEKKYHTIFPQAVPLSPESVCDEGVCVRREGVLPYITKAKTPSFLEHESKLADKGEVDMETQESAPEEEFAEETI